MDCYTSVYSEEQLKTKIYDTFYLEARENEHGNVDLEQAIRDRDIIKGTFDRLGIACRYFYSGGRSFHFYVDFPPTYIENLFVAARNFIMLVGLEDMFDMHTVGIRRSMGRIPYTYNTRYRKYAVYSDADTPEMLEYEASNCIINNPPMLQQQETEFHRYLIEESLFRKKSEKVYELSDFEGSYPECILNIIAKLNMERHAKHNERFHFVAFQNRIVGKTINEMVDSLRNASDFVRAVSEYQVRDIVSKNYKPYGCYRVKAEMPDVCPYSGTRNHCKYIKELTLKNGDEDH